jgi:small subunit ribosomal protein S17e
MGNVRTKDIKKASFELVEFYPDSFNTDFENNKNFIKELKLGTSKIIRNKISGYVTRIKKRQQ